MYITIRLYRMHLLLSTQLLRFLSRFRGLGGSETFMEPSDDHTDEKATRTSNSRARTSECRNI